MFGKNWKTTIAGLVFAAAGFFAQFGSGLTQKIAQTVVIVAGGSGLVAAKDGNVTGGTVQQ